MKKAPKASAHEPVNPLVATAAAKLALAQTRGTSICALSIHEFECLEETHKATAEERPIFCELGVLGYAAGLTLFDSEIWTDKPLLFRELA
jgi:hypothetical protein